jgi:hypothetical protein
METSYLTPAQSAEARRFRDSARSLSWGEVAKGYRLLKLFATGLACLLGAAIVSRNPDGSWNVVPALGAFVVGVVIIGFGFYVLRRDSAQEEPGR